MLIPCQHVYHYKCSNSAPNAELLVLGVSGGSVRMSASGPSDERESTGHGNGRAVSGQFLPGNTAALKHGRRSERHVERLKDQAGEAIAEQREQIIADLGGVDGMSRIQADLVGRYTTASCLLVWMEIELVAKGPLTSKGSRRALHNAYVQQLSQCLKLANLLGLKRVPKSVPTLAQVLSGAADRGPEPPRVARSTAGGYQDQGIPSDSDSGPAPRPCPRPCPRPRLAVRLPGIEPEDGVIPDAELHDGGAP